MGAACAAGVEDGQEEAAEVDPAKGGESSGVGRCGAAAVARSASLSLYSVWHFSWVMGCDTFTDSGEAGKREEEGMGDAAGGGGWAGLGTSGVYLVAEAWFRG